MFHASNICYGWVPGLGKTQSMISSRSQSTEMNRENQSRITKRGMRTRCGTCQGIEVACDCQREGQGKHGIFGGTEVGRRVEVKMNEWVQTPTRRLGVRTMAPTAGLKSSLVHPLGGSQPGFRPAGNLQNVGKSKPYSRPINSEFLSCGTQISLALSFQTYLSRAQGPPPTCSSLNCIRITSW